MSNATRLFHPTACVLGVAVASLCLGAVFSGCGSREAVSDDDAALGLTAPNTGPVDERFARSWPGLRPSALKGRDRLVVTTSDPDDFYVHAHPNAWFMHSTITEANTFDLLVTNQGRHTAYDVELYVAIPSDIAPGGWAVTLGAPAVVFSQLSDFPETMLPGHGMNPHRVYGPHGNAIYARVPGPATLGPGETWSVPVQLFRGETVGFEVHFDAVSSEFWNGPRHDVTANPPMNVGGERVSGPVK